MEEQIEIEVSNIELLRILRQTKGEFYPFRNNSLEISKIKVKNPKFGVDYITVYIDIIA